MTNSSDSKVLASLGFAVASPYVTSESPDTSWGQPSLSHYVFVIDGQFLRGQLIENVYPTGINSHAEAATATDELRMELDSWEAASDEDFAGFESHLD